MNDAAKYDIEGIDEVLNALETLPAKVTNRVLYDANRDIVTRVLKGDIISAIPYSSRTRRGIKVVRARGTQNGVFIGVSTDAFWLRFLQFGTADRYTTGKGKKRTLTKRYNRIGRSGSDQGVNRGAIAPRETGVVSTINSKINDVLQAVTKDYGIFIVDAIAKQLKKYQVKK